MNIRLAVKCYMTEKSMNYVKVQEASKLSSTTIARLGSSAKIGTLERVADALGVKVSDIILKAESFE